VAAGGPVEGAHMIGGGRQVGETSSRRHARKLSSPAGATAQCSSGVDTTIGCPGPSGVDRPPPAAWLLVRVLCERARSIAGYRAVQLTSCAAILGRLGGVIEPAIQGAAARVIPRSSRTRAGCAFGTCPCWRVGTGSGALKPSWYLVAATIT
jgi:hypothetical protein